VLADLALARVPHDNGRVLTVTEPQVWVLIAVFATAIFSMIGIVSVSFTRSMTAALSGFEAKVEGQLIGIRGELTGLRETMDARFQAVDARMQTIDTKIDLLDRDIQALSKRVFGAE
jgi:hypothetical protein